MWKKGMVTECDFTDRKYTNPVEGAHVLAQGATGRFCCVMYAGPEYLEANGIPTMTREEAEAACLGVLRKQNAENGSRYQDDELNMFLDY